MSSRAPTSAPPKPATGQPTMGMASAGPASKSTPPTMVPHEKVAMRAYDKWCQRGCPPGTDQQDWYDAEAELRSEMAKAGGKPGR